MCSLLLVCAALKILHLVKHILSKEECRRIGKAGHRCDDELAVTIAVKPPSVVQATLGVLERDHCFDLAAEAIECKLCSA